MKRCIIMMGIPGSGKSTIAASKLPVASVSADNFFVKLGDGTYRFDPSKLPDAHKACYLDFCGAVAAGAETIIVDNTNTTVSEIAPYERHATAFGYDVEIIHVQCDPAVAAARNTHGVPLKGCEIMASRIAATLKAMPPWWKVTTINTTV